MPHYLIVYDITEDKLRSEVSDMIKNCGGTRIQYSAFIVDLNEPELMVLLSRIKRLIGFRRARLFVLPICRGDMRRRITIVHNYRIMEETPVI